MRILLAENNKIIKICYCNIDDLGVSRLAKTTFCKLVFVYRGRAFRTRFFAPLFFQTRSAKRTQTIASFPNATQ
jgi:hypothetical protein